jgi:flagellar biogenesis protein FliO
MEEPDGGCAAHGAALLIASAAVIVLMALVTFGCWLLYRLIA